MITALILCLTPIAIDGDTVRCADNTRVRIFGIQAPEIGMVGASASTVSLQSLSRGGLRCITKGKSYNRVVGLCQNAALQDVGEQQIRRGHAVEWCRYSRGLYEGC